MAEGKPESRRVRYTRRVIREAFLELLRERPLAKVTVAEVCERADVHRGTFYQHYRDIYDLLGRIEDDVVARIGGVDAATGGDPDVAELAVLAVLEDRDACAALLGPHGDEAFLARLVESRREASYARYRAAGIAEGDFAAVFAYTTAGSLGLIREWVAGGCEGDPARVVAASRRLSAGGIGGLRGGRLSRRTARAPASAIFG